ncbi:phage tail assembly protein [Burkholderia cenocepacia]|uniref:phage tail assembly protein n=1 Tax=Burkholderia cenocepacia TaxID=95486 RepID=UPI001BA0EF0D|nr:phage tail assembly protein [Burkholderia cenocepacia]MBR8114443.1 phage tail assembly protein [Burkholderia cenocepacia]
MTEYTIHPNTQVTHSHAVTHAHVDTTASTVARPGVVVLDTPIKRGEQEITEVTLRKPAAGELRGTSLNALVNLDVDALGKVLPRISSPMLTEFDVQQLDPADLVQLGVAFASFLLPKRAA